MGDARRIVVSGAGIAGCAAAIALSARGHSVRLIERAERWAFTGSGIFLYSNALASLDALGVLHEILEAGFVIPGGRNLYLDETGVPIVTTHYPTAADGRIPAIVGIKRAELHRVLSARIGGLGLSIDLGTTITDVAESDHSVRVTTSDGVVEEADLVVGCEGVSSPLRQRVSPGAHPRYSGFGIWRSVHGRPSELTDKVMMMGQGTRLGIMPISDDGLYIFGTVADPDKTWHDRQEWPRLMAEAFADYQGPARAFLDDIGPESDVLYTAVEEVVLPLPWHRGRLVLIGDAAHAGTPFMGQGGAMALEDALVLADCLSGETDLEAAFTRFGRRRAPMCEFAQDTSRAVGEAGAQRADELTRRAQMQSSAQPAVDSFYAELERLRSGEPGT